MSKNKYGAIVKSNKLIEASYRLGVNEIRILLIAISKIGNEPPTDLKTYKVSIGDIVDLTETKSKDLYRQLYLAARSLRYRWIKFVGYDNKIVETSWVQSIEYDENNNTDIELRFSHRVLPYLTNLKSEFTKYEINEVIKFSSVYAHRFYDLCMQWRIKGSRTLEIEWLRDLFMLEDKYAYYKDFKIRVIEPAIKQINQFTSYQLSYQPVKTGKKITHLKVSFQPKEKVISMESKRPKPQDNPNVNQKDIGNGPDYQHPVYSAPLVYLEPHRLQGESTPALKARLASEGWMPLERA